MGRSGDARIFLAHAESEKPFVAKVKDAIEMLARSRTVRNAPWAQGLQQPRVFFDKDSFSAGRDGSLATFADRAADATLLVLFVPAQGFHASSFVAKELFAFLTGRVHPARDTPYPESLAAHEVDRLRRRLPLLVIVDRHGALAWPGRTALPALCRDGLLAPWFAEERPRLREASSAPDEVAAAVLASAWGVAPELVRSRVSLARRRAQMRAIAGVAVVFAALIAGTAVSLSQRAAALRSAEQATREQQRAEQLSREATLQLARVHQETARQLVLKGHGDQALPYLVAARRNGEQGTPLRVLFALASRGEADPSRARKPAETAPPWLAVGAPVERVAFSRDGTRLAIASRNGTARIWDTASGMPVSAPLVHNGPVTDVHFDATNERLVTVSGRAVQVWDARTGTPLCAPLVHAGEIFDVVFGGDRGGIVVASREAAQFLVDTTAMPDGPVPKYRIPMPGVGMAVVTSAFSADGTELYRRVSEHNVFNEHPARGFGHSGLVLAAAFSPEGGALVTGCADRYARLWETHSNRYLDGMALTPELEHQGAVTRVSFDRSGTRVATVSDDHAARIWSADSGNPVSPSLLHDAEVLSVALSSDVALAVTIAADQTLRVWEVRIGGELVPPVRLPVALHDAAFSPDGRRIVIAADDGVRVWEIPEDLRGLDDWVLAANASPYGLVNDVLVRRSDRHVYPEPSSKHKADLQRLDPMSLKWPPQDLSSKWNVEKRSTTGWVMLVVMMGAGISSIARIIIRSR